MNTQKQIGLIVVLFFLMVGGCTAYSAIDLPHRAVEQADYQHDQSVERGALLFANNCRTCHGIHGQGGVGLPLNKPQLQDQDPLVLAATKGLLTTTLDCGRAGTRMPAWLNTNGGSLNSVQLDHLIDLITEPVDPSGKSVDDTGKATSKGWAEAVEFAYNLNRESSALVGGDTLDTIAKSHLIGYKQLADANHLPVNGILKQGSVLHIPGFKAMPNGYDYHVYNNNESITKVADSQHVGAVILADLNGIPYTFSEEKGKATITLQGDHGPITGLFPGTTIALPQGTQYVITSGDTLAKIAQQLNVSTDSIKSLNPDLAPADPTATLDDTTPLNSARKLKLPPGTGIVVQKGQTAGVLATQHGTTEDAIDKANGLTTESVLKPGEKLKLPEGAEYTIQTGDTMASVATAHGITAEALASANNLKPDDFISPDVVINLPNITKFTITGQSLDDIAKTFSNVTAASLAKANNLSAPDVILRVGQPLTVPKDSWGAAPPSTINTGTACVEHAVPQSVYETLPGVGTPVATPTAPATVSKTVLLETHADDWTLTADGTAQPANKGVATIAKGTTVNFQNVVGLHTITVNGQMQGANFTQGQTRTITFSTAGQFHITCDFHPDMSAYLFVQ
ncbi:MAG TPA: LysM peptidoglycan-binding domain-containing protein [Tepidiformaceae bacterium]|nr:LysM peptidoglycan-binding domain-containing protein [Tepidiformaceae bacterium]